MNPEEYKNWSPAAQEEALKRLRELTEKPWRPFYCPREGCNGRPHGKWSFPHARADQHPPKGNWLTWLIRGGRGSGKTRSGSEWAHRITKVAPRVALIAATGPDARDIMVEGESGIMATAPPGKLPHYEPSKRKITWPNGAIGSIYSAEEPDRLRGPQHHAAWADEPAHYDNIEEVWSNLLFGLRLGQQPRICATTTPKPVPWMKKLVDAKTTISVVASTYANIDNLAPVFREHILELYEGTRLGRQEIHGEILEDVEGALWTWEMIDPYRLSDEDAPVEFDRIVVAVDPAGTANARSDETGIIVVGVFGRDFYVLEDRSGKYSPKGWATVAVSLFEKWSADAIVAEKNYGGDMVKATLKNAVDGDEDMVPVRLVTSRRGKTIRAEPIATLSEKGRLHLVGDVKTLESQLLAWVPGEPSPDRLDAMVHGVTDLAKVSAPTTISSPTQLNRRHLYPVRSA